MFRASREMHFCYGHRLLNHPGKCRHLHGHNGKVIITFEVADLDDRGMVLDFGDIKSVVSRWIDEHLDHRMILNRDDPVVPVLRELGEPMYLLDENPTAENLARLICDFAAERGFPVLEVRLWETPGCFAAYCRERAPDDIISDTEANSVGGGVAGGDQSVGGPPSPSELPSPRGPSQEEEK
jgi:6-pyruvoyltetrahydropterin/6-carboxytetrahydropterin synthase